MVATMRRSQHPFPVFGALALASLPTTRLAAQGVLAQYGEPLVVSGALAPGFPVGAVFATGTFFGGAIDRDGAVLFKARIAIDPGLGIDASNDAAYYLGHGFGDIQLVVRAGTQAPGCPAGVLLRNNTATPSNGLNGLPRLSPSGRIVFWRSGLYDPVTPANTPTNADSALYLGTASNPQLLAREGDLVPFLAAGERWGDLQFAPTTHFVNSSGAVVFQNTLRLASPVTSANDTMLVYGPAGALQLVVREGSTWPGAANQETVGPVGSQVQLNEAGIVLHGVNLLVGSGLVPVTTANDRALAVWANGVDSVIAREGQAAPGLPAGVVFTDASSTIVFYGTSSCSLDQNGTAVFRARLAGGGTQAGVDDDAVFVGNAAATTLVFRRNDPAPGLAAGVRIGAIDDASLAIDDGGRIACATTLVGAVTTADDSVVWLGAPGALAPLLRENDVIAALPPTINGPWRSGDLATARPAVNGSGQVILPLQVTDGVATRVVVLGFTAPGLVRVLVDGAETWSTNLGSSSSVTLGLFSPAGSGDTGPTWFNRHGDFNLLLTLPATPSNLGAVIMRGHLGTLQATPAAVPSTGGFAQDFVLDCGTTHANELYLFAATSFGTSPGFPSPFGPQLVPLNFDPTWTTLSISLLNSAVWTNTFGLLDGNGRTTLPVGFHLPPGLPGLAGTTLHHVALLLDASLTSTFVTEPAALHLL